MLHRFIAVLMLILVGGCGGQRHVKDLTQTLDVQRSGVLGQWHEVISDGDLIKDYGRLYIVAPNYPAWARDRTVGKVQAGTRLVTSRVVRTTDLVAFMVLPVYQKKQRTLAMIVDGPHAGKEVDLTPLPLAEAQKLLVPKTEPQEAAKPRVP